MSKNQSLFRGLWLAADRLHKRFIGLLGGKLFGCLDGILDGRLLRFAVDVDAAFILAPSRLAAHNAAHYLEGHFFVVLLTPVYKLALEIPLGLRHGVHVDVGAQQLSDDDTACETVAFLYIHRTYQRLKGIAAHRLESPLAAALVLYKLQHAYLDGQLAEALAAHYLGAHLGEEPLALERVLLIKILGHHGAKHRVAEVLKTLVVDAVPFAYTRHRTVDESGVIQLSATGHKTQHILEESVEFRAFLLLGEQWHGSVFSEGETYVVATETEGIAQRETHLALLGLVEGEVQRRYLRVVVEVVYRRRHYTVLDRQNGGYGLHSTGSTKQVARH